MGFLKANEASVKELSEMSGYYGGKELIDKGLVFWTLTVWDNDTAMKVFRNSPAHRKAMQKLPNWCNEASYAHWVQEENTIPTWEFAYERMVSDGKITKVRKPSKRQESKSYPPPKWKKIERELKAKS